MLTGIVPITCEELFKGIEAKKGTEAEYQVMLNMLEIYNEQVHTYMHMCSVCNLKYALISLLSSYSFGRNVLNHMCS